MTNLSRFWRTSCGIATILQTFRAFSVRCLTQTSPTQNRFKHLPMYTSTAWRTIARCEASLLKPPPDRIPVAFAASTEYGQITQTRRSEGKRAAIPRESTRTPHYGTPASSMRSNSPGGRSPFQRYGAVSPSLCHSYPHERHHILANGCRNVAVRPPHFGHRHPFSNAFLVSALPIYPPYDPKVSIPVSDIQRSPAIMLEHADTTANTTLYRQLVWLIWRNKAETSQRLSGKTMNHSRPG